MRRLLKFTLVALAPIIFAGFLVRNAEAMTLTGAVNVPAAQNYSPIEKVACNGTWGPHCRPGLHWVCRPNGNCWCAACLGGHGHYWYHGYHHGWRRHFWHRGWHHHGGHRHFWHRGWHHHGGHRHFWHHHGGHHRSDIRLKDDIVPLALLDNGIELYRFRYKGSDHTVYVGVMAQAVQKIEPSAVSRDPDGYLVVDYDRLGLKFMTWDEWLIASSTNDHPSRSPSTN
jgi:Chaperone of endosialidase